MHFCTIGPMAIAPRIIQQLRRAGLVIQPFLVVRENLTALELQVELDGLSLDRGSAADIPALAQLQRSASVAWLTEQFEQGRVCYVVRKADSDALAAVMWCDLAEFNFPPYQRALGANEAYLFAAFADPAFRGRELVPALRSYCYSDLAQHGITRIFSYTDYYNYAARAFKAKLHARDVALCLFVDLFGWWSRTFTLRTFSVDP